MTLLPPEVTFLTATNNLFPAERRHSVTLFVRAAVDAAAVPQVRCGLSAGRRRAAALVEAARPVVPRSSDRPAVQAATPRSVEPHRRPGPTTR